MVVSMKGFCQLLAEGAEGLATESLNDAEQVVLCCLGISKRLVASSILVVCEAVE